LGTTVVHSWRGDAVAGAAAGLRIVLTIVGPPRAAPLDAPARDAYCAYARGVLDRYPTIDDIVIWNEPNLRFFWQPQYNADGSSAAPAAYAGLLVRWDVLHAATASSGPTNARSTRSTTSGASASSPANASASRRRCVGSTGPPQRVVAPCSARPGGYARFAHATSGCPLGRWLAARTGSSSPSHATVRRFAGSGSRSDA
jgi:hypothetical protein